MGDLRDLINEVKQKEEIIVKKETVSESKVKPLSKKGEESIRDLGYLNVWEGAVRSGKTLVSELAFLKYLEETDEQYFIMSGKTISSLYRNVIGLEFGFLKLLGRDAQYKVNKEGNTVLLVNTSKGVKTCYCFGANDERAYQTLRGITAGGWYADEVNLQPQSFVEEAFRRTIVSEDRKNFWTLNPDNPAHWIYKLYIDKYSEEELKGFKHWHFTLDDNLAITDERKEELKKQFSGVFYRRYILGERCIAEGLVYDMLSDKNLYKDHERPDSLYKTSVRTIAVDHGTSNPCVFLDIYDDGDTIWIDNEYRWDIKKEQTKSSSKDIKMQKTNPQYADDMDVFMKQGSGRECGIVVDPAALGFIVELKNRLYYVTSAKNNVLGGIQMVSTLMYLNKIKINEDTCKGLLTELRSYSWDENSWKRGGEEKPIKQLDHGPDALRYYVFTCVPTWRTGYKRSV